MNFYDHKEVLPPGLVDNAVEFFIHENDIKCLYRGQVISFPYFPLEVIDIIINDMATNYNALKALNEWNIIDPDERMKQYIACRFGGFDNSADISSNGLIQRGEYVDCGRRNYCPYVGKLCSSIVLEFGILTKREIDVLRQIGIGLLDKEICGVLGITQDTLRNHKDSLCSKSGVQRKSGLSILAYKYKLI